MKFKFNNLNQAAMNIDKMNRKHLNLFKMKTKKITTKNQLPQSEPLDVHIKVLIEDDDHGYKELDMVTNTEELSQRIDFSKMTVKSNDYYLEIVYSELLNRAFRPKIDLDLVCNSILNYISCHLDIEKLKGKLLEYGDETQKIVAHVNVETDDYSSVSIIPLIEHEGRIISPFNIWEKSIHKLTIPSRLEFLTTREEIFLMRIVKLILNSGDSCFRFDFGQLWDFFIEQIDEQEHEFINKDFLSGVIDTLIFYDFISYTYDDTYEKESDTVVPLKITVFELDIFNKYFQFTEHNHAA